MSFRGLLKKRRVENLGRRACKARVQASYLFCGLLACALAGCGKKAEGPPPRYAVARFDNLSADSSLDWVARAANEILARTLAHALDGPVLTPSALNRAAGAGVSTDRAKAVLAGATHLISGYLEQVNGKLRLYATDEDLVTHRTTRSLSAEATQPLPALDRLVQSFSPSARLHLNPEALKLYGTALDESPERAMDVLRASTRVDPDFGPAWVALIDATSLAGGRTAALDAATEALTHKIEPIDQASVRLLKASLENDKTARLAAMHDLSALTPADLVLLKSLAENESTLGRFAESAGDWKKLCGAAPGDREAWNQLGYALAWSGDLPGALDAMKSYAARWPDDPNPLDSTGDVCFMYGKFTDAAAWYVRANQKGAQLLNGGDLYKAAWAQFRSGDRNKADATFAQFRAVRTKSNAAGFALFDADWLYRTGREKEAVALLRKETESVSPQNASGIWSQLVIQDLLARDRTAAARDAAVEATKPASNIGSIARFAAMPSASAAEWESRAERLLRGPGIESSRRFALGIALLLDGKRDAALPVWNKIAEEAPATDFFAVTVDALLKGEKPKLELIPDSLAVNQLLGIVDRLVVQNSQPAKP